VLLARVRLTTPASLLIHLLSVLRPALEPRGRAAAAPGAGQAVRLYSIAKAGARTNPPGLSWAISCPARGTTRTWIVIHLTLRVTCGTAWRGGCNAVQPLSSRSPCQVGSVSCSGLPGGLPVRTISLTDFVGWRTTPGAVPDPKH